ILARLLVLNRTVHKAVLGGMGADFTNPEWPRRKMFYEALSGKPVPELAAMVSNVKKQGLDTMVLAWLQKYQPATEPQDLKKLKQEVLVISGDQDEDCGSPLLLSQMFPHGKLVLVPGVHNTASQSEAFSKAVIDFLK
ncbi:MAG: alpha/beta fold hydrolase, partial [Flavisolibacter sp.]